MNFCDIKTLLRISFLVIVIISFVECFVSWPSRNSENDKDSHFPLNLFVGLGGGNKDCDHHTTIYGDRKDGDLLVYVETKKANRNIIKKTTVNWKYPSGNSKNDCTITQIKVENLYKECKCYKYTKVMNGGPEYKYFDFNVTSEYNCPVEFKVSCFTKC